MHFSEKVWWVVGTAAAAGAPVVSIDLSVFVNGLIALLLAVVAFLLRHWYISIQQHVVDSEKRFDKIERAIVRNGLDVTPTPPDAEH